MLIVIDQSNGIDVEPILEAYRAVAEFFDIPYAHHIYGHFLVVIERKMKEVQVSIYPDDFYDGNPERQPTVLPDMIRQEFQQQYDLTIEDIKEVLERFCLSYLENGVVVHNAIVEVW